VAISRRTGVVSERGARGARTPRERPPRRGTELSLLILSAIIVTSLYALASLGTESRLPADLWGFLGFVIGISLFLHIMIRIFAPRSSQVLLPIATLLNGIGYIEISRWNPPLARNQVLWAIISAAVVVAILAFVRRIRDLDRYRYLTLLVAVGLMLAPLIPHVGENINGARLWVKLGPLTFQPVEIAKILLAIFFASYFAANKDMLAATSVRFGGRFRISLRTLVPVGFAWVFAILVLGAENDVGFAMLLFAMFISLIWVASGRMTYVALGGGMFGVGGYLGAKYFHQVHKRIAIWLDPWTSNNFHHLGGSQLADGWFSIAAGGLVGTGVGLGKSGDTPALTTDLIFSAVAEELGFIGVVIVLSSFILFVSEGIRIAQRSRNDFTRLTATALSLIIGFQAFFIVAGVLRILPFTGITLPFVAYGGSSLVANYAIVALLLRISDENAQDVTGGEVHAVSFD
jgi:cell division protein FtsW (lipid II flippase)